MFTKKEISEMKEKDFQNKVLIPLFRKMGYQDVTEYGGGSLELGKDIVMWKKGDLGERVNYGVVVKAVKISGKVKGRDTASEVLNQIRQCLTSDYADPVTTEKQSAHRCFVVSSKIIEKSAINSIESQLADSHFDKVTRWIHPGTNLYKLIDEHLPEQNVFEQLSDIERKLNDGAMKIVPYRIKADTDKKFSFLAKHPKAHEEVPFDIKTGFKFDTKTPEGKNAQEEFIEHFTKGKRVEIEGQFIEYFELPEFIPEMLKPRLTEDSKLILEPIRPDLIIPLRFERTLTSGEVVSSGRLDFEIVQPGTEEITLKNDNQKIPLQITMTVNLKTNEINYNFNSQLSGYNVYEHLKALKFFASLSKDGELNIYRDDTGLKIIDSSKGKVEIKENYEGYIKLLEALFLIQQTFQILLTIPEKFTNESLNNISEVKTIISKGKLTGTSPEIPMLVPLQFAKERLELFENEKANFITITPEDESEYNILGHRINIGKRLVSSNVLMSKSNFAKAENSINEGKNPVEFILSPKDGNVTIDFLNWKSDDRETSTL